ncbi:hypothetical protein BOTCAL_0500g00040 [Botryotinia calthae]|uniref:Uncharacterized protein n=1 Tax=Botryotinia calthae TaxID=38488 RepID=A0A4Y8CLG1_9HELO|nr:hypothetical protein BOTCAL_0500g00040 [Botryotinia calthae]
MTFAHDPSHSTAVHAVTLSVRLKMTFPIAMNAKKSHNIDSESQGLPDKGQKCKGCECMVSETSSPWTDTNHAFYDLQHFIKKPAPQAPTLKYSTNKSKFANREVAMSVMGDHCRDTHRLLSDIADNDDELKNGKVTNAHYNNNIYDEMDTKPGIAHSSPPSSTAAISIKATNTGDPTPTTNPETRTKSSLRNSFPRAPSANPNRAAAIKMGITPLRATMIIPGARQSTLRLRNGVAITTVNESIGYILAVSDDKKTRTHGHTTEIGCVGYIIILSGITRSGGTPNPSFPPTEFKVDLSGKDTAPSYSNGRPGRPLSSTDIEATIERFCPDRAKIKEHGEYWGNPNMYDYPAEGQPQFYNNDLFV